IDGAGPGKDKTLIRAIQRDPVRGDLLHIDLHQISMNRPIHLDIPVRLIGTPKGVKDDGGIMQQIVRELEISCLPTQIPDGVEIDVSELGIQDSIHVSDVTLESVTILTEPQRTIVTIVPPTVAKTLAEEEAEAAVGAAEGAEGEGAEGEGESKSED
ncbi:MAG TPA: 50S ribosomal protein L25, partial [candidate division Zixibacteria bacterium]|nr:50S ribosomal protein L25 [candidate division Zixibacteria bacterium]